MPVTQQDIADKVGVSRRVVGFALNDEAGVGAEMRARIIGIADELGYRPNRAAKTLVTGRTYQIALCLPTLSLPFHAQFIHHFEALARDTPYDLLVTTTLGNSRPLPAVDGVLLCVSRPMENISQPTVVIQSPPAYPASVDTAKMDQIFLDLDEASEAAMRHLLELGKSRVAHVTWHTSKNDPRPRAYYDAMQKAQLPVEIIAMDYEPADIRSVACQKLEEYFISHGFPDALFCYNDEVAIGTYRALRKLGRKIPDETAVIGCDNIPETRDLVPSLTTIKHAWDDVCYCAWELLLERIENPDMPLRQNTFPGELVIRDSSMPQEFSREEIYYAATAQ